MKKQLLAGAASLVFAVTPVLSTFAEAPQAGTADGYFTGSKDVTVGQVDETVYSVDIDWGDMAFDWKYDWKTNEHNFQPKMVCTSGGVYDEEHFIAYRDSFGLYTGLCETPVSATDEFAVETTYSYYSYDTIRVKDYTANGRLKVSASFASTDDYEWVTGKIGDWSTHCSKAPEENMTCSRNFNNHEDGSLLYNSTNVDTHGAYRLLLGSFKLEKIPGMGNTEPIATGDKIGTITLDITPDLN